MAGNSVPTGGASGRLVGVDALRAVAALMVMLYHSQIGVHPEPLPLRALQPIGNIGQTGVSLFLVISGFSIHLRWARATPVQRAAFSASDFWKRRFVRLYPAYWLAAIVTVLILLGRFGPDHLDWKLGRVELGGWHPDTILSVINQSTVVLANVVPVPVLAVAWTLALEEQIYALYSAMMAKVRRIRPLRLLVCAAAAAVLWRLGSSVLTDSFPNARAMPGLAYTASGHVLYQQVPSRAFEWVLGLVLAEIYVGRIRAVGVVGRLPLALVGIAAAATLWQKPVGLVTVADHPFYMSDVIVDPLFGVGYFLLLAWTVLSASRTLAGPLQRPLRALGALGLASYSLYLIHPVITESAQPWLPDAGLARVASMLAMWAVAIGVSYTFYLVVERPFVSRSKRVGRAPALPLVASPVPAPASEHSSR